ncbi:ADP-ribose glycohydrolase MACROD2-like isoform X2 [Hypanus sabinus]|uniref:ADP-ribose glycohydrolase MACROD2-like isoform X2 n=1 Tax=Hypanus sabinus TaxID=79690 RepID=UPI0028C4DA81|nr:ADP-ribose glycohydrolase MACROD2-like isoform X2 [Hypanus sabinus]
MPKEKKSTAVWEDESRGCILHTCFDSYDDGVVHLKEISVWSEDVKKIYLKEKLESKEHDEYSPVKEDTSEEQEEVSAQKDSKLSDTISLYRGDITKLKIDAVVNAVDGCIHRAAGPKLLSACRQLNGCNTGEAKITLGYDLPAKHVIHTVGPIARGSCDERLKRQLRNCYETSLKLLETQGLRSIAFPCISTGIYGFPQEDAAEIAVSTIKEWLVDKQDLLRELANKFPSQCFYWMTHAENIMPLGLTLFSSHIQAKIRNCASSTKLLKVDRIIFCVFLESDHKIYKEKLLHHFPIDEEDLSTNSPSSKKYGNKESMEKSNDKIEASVEESGDGIANNSPKKTEDEKHDSPVPLVSHDDDLKLHDMCMDSQIEDKQEDTVMLSQPCTQIEEMEMGSSQQQSEGEDKENNDRIPYIDECEEESGQ